MARNLEKLIKIQAPKPIQEIPEMTLNPCEIVSTMPTLDLTNIEPYTEQGLPIHVDLGLDQLEDMEE
ncbi:MAG: hypothetical protein NWF03_06925 [Candidatus Bathyarchaeota archaeon]|nr:hypothetical protein [Candidatus Bathyarchaeota archaeon]